MKFFALSLVCLASLTAIQERPEGQDVNEIFRRAREAHGSGESVPIQDFRLLFNLIARDQDKNLEFPVEHVFRKPDLIKTSIVDSELGVTVYSGFNGKHHWLFEKEQGLVQLRGMEHDKDIAEIEERIRLSKILIRTFNVKTFTESLKNPRRLPDRETVDGKRTVVQGSGEDFPLLKTPDLPKVDLILFFDSESSLLREVEVTPLLLEEGTSPDPARREKFVLSEYIEVPLGKKTSDQEEGEKIESLLVPSEIHVYLASFPEKASYEITIGEFGINLGLEEKDFLPPGSTEKKKDG